MRIAGREIAPGTDVRLELPVAGMPSGAGMALPVRVIRGRDGPALWLSGAVHGDEINGVEIISRVLSGLAPDRLNGTVIAVPVVNVFGFVARDRYLPDRRDLNRSFPGSEQGSLAARVAYLVMQELLSQVTHGIDIHTGSHYRTNHPHIRARLDDPRTRELGQAFGTGILVDASPREGSLREAADQRGVPCLVYEAGEANRFDEESIRVGVSGVLRVMRRLSMISEAPEGPSESIICHDTSWVRARRSGIFRSSVKPGDRVERRYELGVIGDSFGHRPIGVRAARGGIVLGLNLSPIVYRGDAIVHLAFPD